MNPNRPLHIALMGTRGIPARYGGFETFAEEVSSLLVARGHQVTVYGRRPFGKRYEGPLEHKGVRIRVTPTIMQKYLETPVHALTTFVESLRHRYDAVILCNAANSPFAFLLRLKKAPVVINVDGIERERGKWNALGRLWYRLGEVCSVLFASRVIADAEVIARYYRETYRCDPVVIAYGASVQRRSAGQTLAKFGLQPGRYILYVSRLEPENNALGVIQAYNRLGTDVPLVIVGDAPYARDYIEILKKTAGPNVIFTGFQFGEAYQEFQSNCLLYIQATEVGGTHPALVESMAYGNCVVANGTPENREVLGDAGLFYDKNRFDQLTDILRELVNDPAAVGMWRERARQRAERLYRWEKIVDQYEELIRSLIRGERSSG